MELFWTNRCKENGFRCPKCQLIMGDKNGQMPVMSKNHRIQWFDGQVKCVACNTTIGYVPSKSKICGKVVEYGMSEKILKNVEYVTAIEQEDF